ASLGAQAQQPSGRLRINAPVSYGIARLAPLLPRYAERHPQVELDLSLSDRQVDMVEEGFDLAIRTTRQPAPSLIARRLAEAAIVLCAAPAYLARHGTPERPDDLS
ncbi:substrate binding domain-containing protein, partial [Stenotrophomonas acidaminiphila]|nr:substrate binding domain-containing protein [Stenotrophomonas acidaminiphila]